MNKEGLRVTEKEQERLFYELLNQFCQKVGGCQGCILDEKAEYGTKQLCQHFNEKVFECE